jgi:Flp pilus assembly protein TadD
MDKLVRQLREAHGYIELGMIDDAANVLEEIAPELKCHPEVMAMRVLLYRKAQNWPLLEVVAGHLTKVQPKEVTWWVDWAFATRRATSVEEAEKILLKAIELHPQEAILHFNLGCYACQLGRIDEAKNRIAQAVRLDRQFQSAALDDPDLEPMWADFGKIEE